jgi:hypothetical protein
MIDDAAVRLRWDAVSSRLDERGRRLFAAAEVRSAGRGGLVIVSKITGSPARRSIAASRISMLNHCRRGRFAVPVAVAGRFARTIRGSFPRSILVEPATLGDPMRPLIWVSKSMEKLAATLTQMVGHPISANTVCKELVKLGFSRQSNRKADEGSKHPDRNAQFEYINAKVIAAQDTIADDALSACRAEERALAAFSEELQSLMPTTLSWPSNTVEDTRSTPSAFVGELL